MSEMGVPPQGQTVDDVLSAIRRLVQEEERQRRTPSDAPESLILTTEMRVDEPPLALTTPEPDPLPEGIDPEELAELVREIVREELRGELGDRISANIRKLVRREISRALAARMAE